MSSFLAVDKPYSTTKLVEQIMATNPEQKVLNWAKHPVESLRNLLVATENAARVGEFETILKEMGWKPGQEVTFEQYMEAQMAAANVNVDFREGGYISMFINRVVPFHNASIQGPHRMVKAFQERPAQTMLNILGSITLPSIIMWYLFRDEEWYKELSAYEKARYWHYKLPNGVVLRIPKPFEWAHLFGTVPVANLEYMERKNPKLFNDVVWKEGRAIFTPPIWPTVLKGGAEIALNQNFFSGHPIVNPNVEGRLAKQHQVKPYTTQLSQEFSRLMGDWLGYSKGESFLSPMQIDHLIQAYGGRMGLDAIKVVEGKAGIEKEYEPLKEMADLPVAGRLFLREAKSRTFDDFYTFLEMLDRRVQTQKHLRGRVNQRDTMRLRRMNAAKYKLAEYRDRNQLILRSRTMSDKRKRLMIARNTDRMIREAKRAMGKNPFLYLEQD